MQPAEISVPLSWGTLAGLHWRNPGAPKVLCLHGWLDNSASFIPLSPYLADYDVVALDFAGHGKSDHRPPASRYYFSEYVYDLDASLDQLEWDRCHIIGHSLGGGMGSQYAAAMPERVERLVMLDTIGVITRSPQETASQLRLSIKSVRSDRSFLRPYQSVNEAVSSRQRKSELSTDATRLLVERALEHVGSHYQWRTDPRLNWRSPLLMTIEQALSVLNHISAPTLTITTPAITDFLGQEAFDLRLAAIKHCEHHHLEGHHHIHMESPQLLSGIITPFLNQQEQDNDHQ